MTDFYWGADKEACKVPPSPFLPDIHRLLRTSESHLLIVSMAAEVYRTVTNSKKVIHSWSPKEGSRVPCHAVT